jgi:hypothetical protein
MEECEKTGILALWGLTGTGSGREAGRAMARPIRIRNLGAVYHVMARGKQGREVFYHMLLKRHIARTPLFMELGEVAI